MFFVLITIIIIIPAIWGAGTSDSSVYHGLMASAPD